MMVVERNAHKLQTLSIIKTYQHDSQNHTHHVFVVMPTMVSWRLVLYSNVYHIAKLLLYLTKIQTLSSFHIGLRSELTDMCQNSSKYSKYNKLYIAMEAVLLSLMYQLCIKNKIFSLLIMNTRIKKFVHLCVMSCYASEFDLSNSILPHGHI